MEIKEQIEKLSKVVHDFKESNDKELAEIKSKGDARSDVKQITDKMNDEITKLQDEIKALSASSKRVDVGGEAEGKDNPEMKKLLNRYLRKGGDNIFAQYKALSVDSDPDGGMLVMPEMSAEIVKKVYESSPLRQLASVQVIGTDSLELIEDLDEAGSEWVGETASRATTDTPQFNKVVIFTHELSAKPKASQKILDDANVNIESWIASKVAEKFARDEATAFITGNGVGKPMGLASYASGTSFGQIEQVVSGSAAALTADGLIDLFYSLKDAYLANAAFGMQRASVKAVRKLVDQNDQYLWQPGLQSGQPDSLLGKPLYQAADLAAIGANNLPVAFGDFRAGYQIVDRFGIRVLRDPYSSKPYIEFYTTKRVGGAVKNFEAIKLQKCST